MSNVPTVCLTPERANDINTDSFDELTKKMEDMAKKSEEDQEQIQQLKEQIVIAEEAAKIKNLPVEISDCGKLSTFNFLKAFCNLFLIYLQMELLLLPMERSLALILSMT